MVDLLSQSLAFRSLQLSCTQSVSTKKDNLEQTAFEVFSKSVKASIYPGLVDSKYDCCKKASVFSPKACLGGYCLHCVCIQWFGYKARPFWGIERICTCHFPQIESGRVQKEKEASSQVLEHQGAPEILWPDFEKTWGVHGKLILLSVWLLWSTLEPQ